jgi:hypothetical protein
MQGPVTQPEPSQILQTGFAFWVSKTLLSAVELEVFTELARGPANVETLQGPLGVPPRWARDFFDALVALNFWCGIDRACTATPRLRIST